ncbi:Mov34/MPN/PAD-1 family protein [Paenibacillus sp. ACRRX]|uniref:Mov34/MPN/PAD-1 family protein n=1 Tax=Paenibacillus sp. ACRRX TaxID=2918206 RepID=UPI001EF57B5B|nr:Mov34/MPN/PAD-1 family protein [Paenibacillus sp. ACRRX]MCG7406053.1 Mov34/MPN/PAD-1 family protein [Paenibacillus sp. ACRRX]
MRQTDIQISDRAHQQLLEHALTHAPEECCGLLLRSHANAPLVYHTYEELTNAASNRTHTFLLEPNQLIDLVYRYPKSMWDILFVHSHPLTPPTLSATDIQGLALSARLFNGIFIVSLQHGSEHPSYACYEL